MSESKKDDVKRCVLAFSGGLDTSCILVWLIEKGFEVVCYLADVGQVNDDVKKIEAKALKLGAKKCYTEDLRKEFVTDFVFPFIRSNAIYEGRYMLGTSIARPLIAKRQVEIAHLENCKYLSHGATGKGNDQVRFELTANALDPSLKMIAPWRDPEFTSRFRGRQDLLEYAAQKGIEVVQSKKEPWSIDENLFHTSYESGILEDPNLEAPDSMFKVTADPINGPADTKPEKIIIHFKRGDPVKVENLGDKTVKVEPLDLFLYLNELGRKHGIGRVDIVENRYVGIKSRGVYETPGGTIMRAAHMDIESLCLDREVLRLRDSLTPQFAKIIYDGYWYSPEMDFLMACMDKSQELVDGTVTLLLGRGNVRVTARSSPYSRYSEALASMDDHGDYNPADAAGFIRINGVRLKVHHHLLQTVRKSEPERIASSKVPLLATLDK